MVKINKKRIVESAEKYKPAKISKNDLYFKDTFNKKLSITIPGPPQTDSRPRRNGNFFYNPKKAQLKKLFRELYDQDELLQETCIPYPVAIVCKVYHTPKKKFQRKLDEDRLKNEEILSIKRKDNDNYEKVHWDILEDEEFRIILNDQYVCKNITEKYYTLDDPRIEINILYSDNFQESIYENDVKSSVRYNKQMLSSKYLATTNMDEEEFVEHFKKHIKKFTLNKVENVQDFLHQNLTKEQIDILISNICPELLTKEHVINYKQFAEYIVNTNGKLQ